MKGWQQVVTDCCRVHLLSWLSICTSSVIRHATFIVRQVTFPIYDFTGWRVLFYVWHVKKTEVAQRTQLLWRPSGHTRPQNMHREAIKMESYHGWRTYGKGIVTLAGMRILCMTDDGWRIWKSIYIYGKPALSFFCAIYNMPPLHFLQPCHVWEQPVGFAYTIFYYRFSRSFTCSIRITNMGNVQNLGRVQHLPQMTTCRFYVLQNKEFTVITKYSITDLHRTSFHVKLMQNQAQTKLNWHFYCQSIISHIIQSLWQGSTENFKDYRRAVDTSFLWAM